MVHISLSIENCEKCPYHKSTKLYTADSFECVREIFCSQLNKNVYNYLDWNEKAKIPNICPFKSLETNGN